MARSRSPASRGGARGGLSREQRSQVTRLKKAGVYSPRGTPSARSLRRKLRQPGMQAVARGEAKAVKVGRRAAREFQGLPRAKDRVIIAERPGFKIYARKGEIFEVETDSRGRRVSGGEIRRFAKGPPGEMPARAPPGFGYAVTVNDNPSPIFFNTYESAQRFMRERYQSALRAQRRDPDAIIVRVDYMSQTAWTEIMESREERRRERLRRMRERSRELRAFARSIRPIR